MFRKLLVLTLLAVGLVGDSLAQDQKINIRAIDGKSGKPIAHQRLVIFGGESEEATRFHQNAFDIATDDRGMAELKFSAAKISWIQVWADGMTLCQTKPNLKSFSVETITSAGLSAPNSCGSVAQAAAPGFFTVYARSSNIREKMGR